MYSEEHRFYRNYNRRGENLDKTYTTHALDVLIKSTMSTKKISNRMEDFQQSSAVVYEKDFFTSTIQTDLTTAYSNNNDHINNIITTLATNNDIESATIDNTHKILKEVNHQ